MAGITRVSGNTFINPVMDSMKDVIDKEDSCQILRTDLSPMESLLHDTAAILFRDEVDIAAFIQDHHDKAALELVKTWLQLLYNSLTEAKRLLSIDNWGTRQRCVDCIVNNPRRPSKQIRHWKASFDHLYRCFQSDFSILVTSLQFDSAKPLYKEEPLYREIGAEEFTEIQPVSQDDARRLFCRVAFKDDQFPVDIQESARKVADECKCVPLTIAVVAAAMMGKTSAPEWDSCLTSMINVYPSFPAATCPSHLDAQLYARLRYAYDALPSSDVKRCFLYCAMYSYGAEIDTLTLLQMWFGEGLLKSKQGTYLMDMAIGRKYLKLLVDRRLFQKVKQSTHVFKQRTIRVSNCIHDMAVYIGQTEENFLLMPTQDQRNFRVVADENCSRMSVASNSMEHLPTELRCPKLASLSLQGMSHLKELPSDFLLSVTSLRVLNLSGCTQIRSIPTSIGQLKMLEFLSLQKLAIGALPRDIFELSKLQFLDLSYCQELSYLPSQIGQLTNLKHLNLDHCSPFKIAREMSELTSLSRLHLHKPLSVDTEEAASIWSLKGLRSLTELRIWIDTEGFTFDGLMGTWSEMRHLHLMYANCYERDLLPEDMQNMKKLQSFRLSWYKGLRLPNCKFEHLEMVKLSYCDGIRELSPLERLPILKLLKLWHCNNLRELGIGSPNGYVRLQKLVLKELHNLEYLDGAPNWSVWDERTLPQLSVLKIRVCSSLKRFPKGMEKLRNLSALKSEKERWESIMREDDEMRGKLQKFFIPL